MEAAHTCIRGHDRGIGNNRHPNARSNAVYGNRSFAELLAGVELGEPQTGFSYQAQSVDRDDFNYGRSTCLLVWFNYRI